MPNIKTYAPNGAGGRNGVSERQRALAQMLAQEGTSGHGAAPAMPAGKAGLGLALGNAAMSAIEGMQYKAQSDKEAAAQQASRDRFGHMAKGYQDSLAPGVPGAGGGPGRAPSSLGSAIQGAGSSANAATAYRYFLDKGLPEASARALVGGFQQESGPGLNTGAVNKGDGSDGSSSIGIAQWNSDRAAGLRSFAAKAGRDPGDLRTQLDFTWSELNGPEKASLQRLMAATDDRSATAAAVGYERPAGYKVDNPEAAVTFGKRLANTTALAGLANAPDTAPAPAAGPSTATASADMPAPNASPAMASGLPGSMADGGSPKPSIPMLSDYMEPDGKSITPENQARYEADRAAAAKAVASADPQDGAAPIPGGGATPDLPQQGATAPIPGSAFTPPADLEGGVVDANVATSPGSVPTDPNPSLRDAIAAAMKPDMGTPALTPANPNGAPGAMGQPADMLDNAPWPSDGGMNDALDSQSVRPMFPAPQPGEEDPDGLRAALQAQLQGQSTAPSLGTDPTLSQDNARSAAQGGAAFPADVGAAIGADSGVPAILGASFVSDRAKGQGGVPFADMSGDIRAGSPDQVAGADVPLPPQRPPQALIDMLAGGDGPSKLTTPDAAAAKANHVQVATNMGTGTVDGTSTGSIGPQGTSVASGAMPQPDLPARNAQPAMGSGFPGGFGGGFGGGPGGGFSGVGKQATETSPQAFNLQQSGGAPSMADVLTNWSPSSAPAARPAMSPDQRAAMVSYLRDGSGPAGAPMPPPGSVGPGSAFRQGMDGGDLKAIAAKQYAKLLGDGQDAPAAQPSPQTLAMAQQLDPRVIPAPAGAPPAPGGGGSPAYLQEAAATLGDPYATSEEKAYAKTILERQMPAKAEPYTLHAGEQRFDGNNRLVASVPANQQDRYEYREVGGRLVAVNKADPTDVRDATPAGMPSGYRAATAEERQAYGVRDGSPLVIGPDGKPQTLSGGTNVTVNNAANPILKGLGDQFVAGAEEARAAADTVRSIQTARAQLSAPGGIVSGQFANPQLALQKAGAALGIGDTSSITNTETFRAAVKPIVLSTVKGLGAGSGISNADRDFAERAVGGSITLDASSIGRIMDITERAARAKIDRQNALAEQMLKTQPDLAAVAPMLRIQAPPEIPMGGGGGAAPGTPAPQGAPGGQAGGVAVPSDQQRATAAAAPSQAISQARAAIASGKSRAAVIQRLQQLGISPEGL